MARHLHTLCWTCQNACGGCSWSDRSFTPVEGWDAVPTVLHAKHTGERVDSFLVKECPQYKADEGYKPEEYDDFDDDTTKRVPNPEQRKIRPAMLILPDGEKKYFETTASLARYLIRMHISDATDSVGLRRTISNKFRYTSAAKYKGCTIIPMEYKGTKEGN